MAAATWHCKREGEREREGGRRERERKVMRMLQTDFNFRRVAYNLQAVFRLSSACLCVSVCVSVCVLVEQKQFVAQQQRQQRCLTTTITTR